MRSAPRRVGEQLRARGRRDLVGRSEQAFEQHRPLEEAVERVVGGEADAGEHLLAVGRDGPRGAAGGRLRERRGQRVRLVAGRAPASRRAPRPRRARRRAGGERPGTTRSAGRTAPAPTRACARGRASPGSRQRSGARPRAGRARRPTPTRRRRALVDGRGRARRARRGSRRRDRCPRTGARVVDRDRHGHRAQLRSGVAHHEHLARGRDARGREPDARARGRRRSGPARPTRRTAGAARRGRRAAPRRAPTRPRRRARSPRAFVAPSASNTICDRVARLGVQHLEPAELGERGVGARGPPAPASASPTVSASSARSAASIIRRSRDRAGGGR